MKKATTLAVSPEKYLSSNIKFPILLDSIELTRQLLKYTCKRCREDSSTEVFSLVKHKNKKPITKKRLLAILNKYAKLSGSRHFGIENPNSDYDYFTVSKWQFDRLTKMLKYVAHSEHCYQWGFYSFQVEYLYRYSVATLDGNVDIHICLVSEYMSEENSFIYSYTKKVMDGFIPSPPKKYERLATHIIKWWLDSNMFMNLIAREIDEATKVPLRSNVYQTIRCVRIPRDRLIANIGKETVPIALGGNAFIGKLYNKMYLLHSYLED